MAPVVCCHRRETDCVRASRRAGIFAVRAEHVLSIRRQHCDVLCIKMISDNSIIISLVQSMPTTPPQIQRCVAQNGASRRVATAIRSDWVGSITRTNWFGAGDSKTSEVVLTTQAGGPMLSAVWTDNTEAPFNSLTVTYTKQTRHRCLVAHILQFVNYNKLHANLDQHR